jgi:hypothetical protein
MKKIIKYKNCVVYQIPKPKKIEVFFKVVFSPIFYIWAVIFAFFCVLIIIIGDRKINKQQQNKEFEESIKELKEMIKNDIERDNRKTV